MKTIAIANQKGGTGKTTTTYNLGIALTQQGYRVLMVDFDPQGNLSCYCGIPPEKDLDQTITELLMKTSCEKPIGNRECVYQTGRKETAARVDFIPSNLRLAGFELAMGTMMCREVLLKACLEQYNNQYDYCLIDCSPSVGLLLTNALAAANEIIIPMQAQPFSVVGMSQLTSSIANVQRKINPGLRVKGILLTMTEHTNVSDHYCGQVRSTYGNKIHVFTTEIPRNVNRDGQQLFQVRNGQRIIENYADGSRLVKDVQTVDDTHFYVGSRFCHIQQYANQCFKRGCYVEPEHPQPGDKLDRLLIYQISHYTCEYRFTDYDYAQNKLKATDYRCAYVANMPRDYTPDKCFRDFNYDDRPCANSMPSLSVSDLIVMERGDKAEALYVDAVGFKDVSRLLPELYDMEVERQEHNLDELER